jgi:anti-anti-sigma regulatory factor
VIARTTITIKPSTSRLSYSDASEISQQAIRRGGDNDFLVDLEQTSEISTAALARLVLLRSRLLKIGSDLHIQGLRGKAKDVYDICRLGEILPHR